MNLLKFPIYFITTHFEYSTLINKNPYPYNYTIQLAAKELATLPFNSAELFTLYQYYFSPPQTINSKNRRGNGMSTNINIHHNHQEEDENVINSDEDEDSQRKNHDYAVRTAGCERGKRNSEAMKQSAQPKKRPGNRSTLARIALYPRIKVVSPAPLDLFPLSFPLSSYLFLF